MMLKQARNIALYQNIYTHKHHVASLACIRSNTAFVTSRDFSTNNNNSNNTNTTAAPTPSATSGGAQQPKGTSGPIITAAPPRPLKNISIHSLAEMKKKKIPISMFTAYDFPSAVHVDKAGIDVLLVGDSVGMVELGMDTTLPVTIDDMVHHCKAVSRGCHRPLLVGDLPFGTYEADPKQAVMNAARILKEGRMDAVKLEGGRKRADIIRAVVDSGIAVMGHIGLTPQSYSALGGFKAQGRTAQQAMSILDDAYALQEAGVFAMVIECVPAVVAKEITQRLDVPTIGIGSGPYTDGQVLVFHDALGMMQHPHHAQWTPAFCKQYAKVGYEIQRAIGEYNDDVKQGKFPSEVYSPYKITKEEEERMHSALSRWDKITTAHKKKKQSELGIPQFDKIDITDGEDTGAIYGGGDGNGKNKKN